ncbi:MAG: hypothetical protein JRN26_01120 [Nitrososphaerota archaeon]|nr:hypothetical protein [Nitrososphaerota archaeon]MDG6932918.1 hypothetical protein [Nitrososphaerota archaeon]MDG6935480.1 hypothetical protein [Nitrososphaerota archaeon]MDG6943613.1 hypothetical protein [Nitrososphaerota archaeon]
MGGNGYVTIAIREELSEKLRQMYEREKAAMEKHNVKSFSKFVASLLWTNIEADEMLRHYVPYLSLVGWSNDGRGMFIRDEKIDRIVEVYLMEDELWCDVCKSDHCVHTGFAYAIPEAYNVLKHMGYRKEYENP